jgi:hypothetical protein
MRTGVRIILVLLAVYAAFSPWFSTVLLIGLLAYVLFYPVPHKEFPSTQVNNEEVPVTSKRNIIDDVRKQAMLESKREKA